MHTEFMQITVELAVGFFALLLIIKLLGRTQIKQLTPFDFISSIVISELLGNAIYAPDSNVWHVLYALLLWGTLMYVSEKITLRSRKFRTFFNGKPAILIYNGVIDRDQLQKHRLTVNQLQSMLRQSETFSIREVQFAILEINGSISILKKHQYQKTTVGDLQLPTSPQYLPVTLILDGEVLWDNMQEAGFDDAWLHTRLREHGLTRPQDVLIAEWLQGDGLYLLPMEKRPSQTQSA